MSELLIIVAVIVFSIGLRTFRIKALRKIGALGFLAATFLAFYFPTGSILAGIGGLLIWFLLPWVELLTRIRQLRLPINKKLEKATPPNTAIFPAFLELTDEVEAADFEYVSDTGWEWDGMTQFFRLFYHEEHRLHAAICFTEQDGIGWGNLTLTCRRENGLTYRTTNLPFSNFMKASPDVMLLRTPECETFQELLDEHLNWMNGLALEAEHFIAEDPANLTQVIEAETGRQIDYNIESGLIRLAEKAETFRYTWRGLIYLYVQLVKDMVRMC